MYTKILNIALTDSENFLVTTLTHKEYLNCRLIVDLYKSIGDEALFAACENNKIEPIVADALSCCFYVDSLPQYWSDAFEEVEENFSALKDECIYISDNPKKDFIAPNKLGWDSIHIKRSAGEYAREIIPNDGYPKKSINSLYDLEDILSI